MSDELGRFSIHHCAMNDETLFIDIDTQIDFMLPTGALYVPGAEKLIPRLERLTEHARRSGIPIISTADAHAPQDPEFQQWPPHCVAGTLGQRKVPETLLPSAVTIPNLANGLPQSWQSAPQLIVEKQTLDVFQTHTIRRVLEGRRARRYVLYGVVTEFCVRWAAVGLLTEMVPRGASLEIVSDAILEIDPARGQEVLRALRGEGTLLITTEKLLGG